MAPKFTTSFLQLAKVCARSMWALSQPGDTGLREVMGDPVTLREAWKEKAADSEMEQGVQGRGGVPGEGPRTGLVSSLSEL